MLLILPPSETKRDGGGQDVAPLQLASLGFPELTPQRRTAIAALNRVSRTVRGSMEALRLGATQRAEIERNRSLMVSPVLPALDRYTGVLFDGLDAPRLTEPERAFAERHLVIHSALFGLIGASDLIPAYRLSHDSMLPGLSLKRLWREPVTRALLREEGLVLDLRSESYVALGAAPAPYVRVVTESTDGRRVALSHFNKKGKGEFVRAIVRSGIDHDSVDSLLGWAQAEGIRLELGRTGELDLVV